MTSSAVSRTRIFCPVVKAITVSGVISTCSIRSELTTSGTWFKRVRRITRYLSAKNAGRNTVTGGAGNSGPGPVAHSGGGGALAQVLQQYKPGVQALAGGFL